MFFDIKFIFLNYIYIKKRDGNTFDWYWKLYLASTVFLSSQVNIWVIIMHPRLVKSQIIKIIISIRGLKFIEEKLRAKFRDFAKQLSLLTSTMEREIDFPSTGGNSRTGFSENFPKRPRRMELYLWRCGQCCSRSYQYTLWAVGHGILSNVNHTGRHAPYADYIFVRVHAHAQKYTECSAADFIRKFFH